MKKTLTFAAALGLLAMVLPATAGVALGHDATPSCGHIQISNSELNATIYIEGTDQNPDPTKDGAVALGPVAGNATYAIAAGTYDVVWSDGFKVEDVVVTFCTPSISTSLSGGNVQPGANITVPLGTSVTDVSTLAGATSTAGGTVTYTVFGDANCTTPIFDAGTKTVANHLVPHSNAYTVNAAGTYYWQAEYSGDPSNKKAKSTCDKETVTVPKNTPTVVTHATGPDIVGGSISDTATLAGGYEPTGSITFNLYGPNDATCAGAVIFTSTRTVSGNGDYTSGSFPTVSYGTYRWIANYSGDTNNAATANGCNAANESVVISPGIPAINTSADESDVPIGNAIHDSASLAHGYNHTGKITFTAYSDANCTVPVFTTDVTVTGNVNDYGPVSFVPASPGTYHWIAEYSGDSNNYGSRGACGDDGENDTVIQKTPAISSLATDGGVPGDKISDTSTLLGAYLPTAGTVTFKLYGSGDPTCENEPLFTSTVAISPTGTATSGEFTAVLAGTYHWIASYSGDANNDAVAGTCGAEHESTTISKFNPEISTSLSAEQAEGARITVLFGNDVTDQATLSSASATAGGTVAYTVWADSECTTLFAHAGVKDVVNGVPGTSDAVNFPNAGTFYWSAEYSGDPDNAPANSNCADEVVTVTTPIIHAVKTVDGEHSTTANAGDVLHYVITVTNTGDAAGTADVTDDVSAILAHATIGAISDGGTLTAGVITWPQFTLAALTGSQTLTFEATLNASFPNGTTHLPNAVVVVGTGSNCAPSAEQSAECTTDTSVSEYLLNIQKTNNAPLVTLVLPANTTADLPTAAEGSTVTYTLGYTVGKLSVHSAVITDVLPAGIQYVVGSATSNDEFTFGSYDSTTRTLSWTAAHVTTSGSVTYKALVLTGASAISQPLTNVATIDSAQTEPASATSKIFVPVVPKGETAPPTDVLVAPDGTNSPGSSMMLILAVLGLLVLGIGFITPIPAAVRRRDRR